ncbi:MAG: bifunctional N(6)-L-threonylcarbamoyladenine synthase/serine/threonine protein kinase [Candidatus Woesearchaeota archaeon]
MYCLGIESTAHTFGAAVVEGKNVLSNERATYTTEAGGMLPQEVAKHHVEGFDSVIYKALSSAGISAKDIGLISFSQGPGLGHCLRVGAIAARALAARLECPLIGVNHCIAHLEIGQMLFDSKDPVLLYASGANTQIIAYEGGRYRIFGETLDIGIGNFLDSVARAMGEGFPGGPRIAELALSGSYVELPYVVKGMDVSFGGLLTNVMQKLSKYKKEDIAYSVQETAFAMLLEVSERALAHTEKQELILGGGVACNSRLQEMARVMCDGRGVKCHVPDNDFLVDNAAMIAWLGLLEYSNGVRTEDTRIRPYERTDEVYVSWR